jgi:hypothetical protein
MPEVPATTIKCIMREERHKFLGWRVKTQWKGEICRARFADSEHGGVEGSLEAAIQWRNEQDIRMGKPRTKEWVRSSGASGRSGKRYEWKR